MLLPVAQMLFCDSTYPSTWQTLCIYKLFAAESPVENAKRRRFNKIAAGGRVLLEQVYGTWKVQFPYLRETMRLNMENCVTVIITTALLHNILVLQGNGYLEDSEVSSDDSEPDVDMADADNNEGQALVLDNSVQTALKEEF